jgi:hypothetical protein
MSDWRDSIRKSWPRPEAWRALLLLGLALGSGCAELTPLPPLGSLDAGAREKAVEAHRVEVGSWTAHVGGRYLPYVRYFDLAAYYRDCRCPDAAALAQDWDEQQKWVILSSLGGALLLAGTQLQATDQANLVIAGVTFMALGADLNLWSRNNWLRPSAEAFDRCLDSQLTAAGAPPH